jgi:hypothetical protein
MRGTQRGVIIPKLAKIGVTPPNITPVICRFAMFPDSTPFGFRELTLLAIICAKQYLDPLQVYL